MKTQLELLFLVMLGPIGKVLAKFVEFPERLLTMIGCKRTNLEPNKFAEQITKEFFILNLIRAVDSKP